MTAQHCFFRVHDEISLRHAHKTAQDCRCSWSAVSLRATAGCGLKWFEALLERQGIERNNAIVDCGSHQNMALAAMDGGFKRIALEQVNEQVSEQASDKKALLSLAHQHQATLLTDIPPCLGCTKLIENP